MILFLIFYGITHMCVYVVCGCVCYRLSFSHLYLFHAFIANQMQVITQFSVPNKMAKAFSIYRRWMEKRFPFSINRPHPLKNQTNSRYFPYFLIIFVHSININFNFSLSRYRNENGLVIGWYYTDNSNIPAPKYILK